MSGKITEGLRTQKIDPFTDPDRSLGLEEFEFSRISRQSDHEGGRFISLRSFLVHIFVRGLVESRVLVRPEVLGQWKIPMKPSGMEHVTFRLVAHCFNQLRHRLPHRTLTYCLLSYTKDVFSAMYEVSFFFYIENGSKFP